MKFCTNSAAQRNPSVERSNPFDWDSAESKPRWWPTFDKRDVQLQPCSDEI